MLKKTKLFFVVACLLLSFAQATPNKTFAAEMTSQSQSTVKNDYTTIKTYVQKFFNSHNGKGTLNDPIELYNLNNNLQALFFSSNSGGYLIVNLADYTIPEFSPVDKNSFITVNGKKHFYNGPLSYLEEDNNGQVIDSKTKQNRGSLKNLKDHDIFQKGTIIEQLRVQNTLYHLKIQIYL
ncbi:hypothetical protein [Clostridium sp. OS1-26]|uniref:hypothetical protein n=1 Tax=Clostridium sp. OS1-26 TaxID=3070681 RepID=UPI0027E00DB0|nr:hypothetical protein [Clostridium sp. OS1-26]WML36192.1 hypothetical protein RCG18_05615 [Clostridium sp. OS1-26]